MANQFEEKWLKETVKEAFDYVLKGKGWKFSKDSTSVLTARKIITDSDRKVYENGCLF